jgi:hypothetical protein
MQCGDDRSRHVLPGERVSEALPSEISRVAQNGGAFLNATCSDAFTVSLSSEQMINNVIFSAQERRYQRAGNNYL